MISMTRRNQVGTVIVGVAVFLFVVPTLFPVQPVLTHDTRHTVPLGPDEIRETGFELISYENLSDRGQELYVETLERGGVYRVPRDDGASDFSYPTHAERQSPIVDGSSERPGIVVIKRPENDSGLPEADELALQGPLARENQTQQDQLLRYDAMRTVTEQPPLGSPTQLIRLVMTLLAVLSLGVGGYVLSSK